MSTTRKNVLENVRSQLSAAFIPVTPPSPVPRLLAGNGTPTEAERILIREAITVAEDMLKQNIADGPASADSMRRTKSREAWKEFVRSHKALLLPVRDLPPEILQQIFLLF